MADRGVVDVLDDDVSESELQAASPMTSDAAHATTAPDLAKRVEFTAITLQNDEFTTTPDIGPTFIGACVWSG